MQLKVEEKKKLRRRTGGNQDIKVDVGAEHRFGGKHAPIGEFSK